MLNDHDTKKLYVFKIPTSSFSNPSGHFYIREDKNRPSITIEGNDIQISQDGVISVGGSEVGEMKIVSFDDPSALVKLKTSDVAFRSAN